MPTDQPLPLMQQLIMQQLQQLRFHLPQRLFKFVLAIGLTFEPPLQLKLMLLPMLVLQLRLVLIIVLPHRPVL